VIKSIDAWVVLTLYWNSGRLKPFSYRQGGGCSAGVYRVLP